MANSKEKFRTVVIQECLQRTVRVPFDEASTSEEAVELIEERCNSGEINLTGKDFISRTVEVSQVE